ncbi:MAG: methyl-accepting chemotaxis protein [Rhodovulum sp.]
MTAVQTRGDAMLKRLFDTPISRNMPISSAVIGLAIPGFIRLVLSRIYDIAFQTNLLALNAGVETRARARRGHGFTVNRKAATNDTNAW